MLFKQYSLANNEDSTVQNLKSASKNAIKVFSLTPCKDSPNSTTERNKNMPNKEPLIFISHCSEDKVYSDQLIALLQRMQVPNDRIFSFSSPGHGIPLEQDIYHTLKQKLSYEQPVFVVFLLSKNFYNSPDCLNEMGAAWIASKKQIGILLPNFEFKQIRGVVERSKIHMEIGDKSRINDLKSMLEEFFLVSLVSGNPWEKMRDDFIDAIKNISASFLPENGVAKDGASFLPVIHNTVLSSASNSIINLNDATVFHSPENCNTESLCIVGKDEGRCLVAFDFTVEDVPKQAGIAFRLRAADWTEIYKTHRLQFNIMSNNEGTLLLEVKSGKNRNVRYSYRFNLKKENHKIPLAEVFSHISDLQRMKELVFLFKPSLIKAPGQVEIANTQLVAID